MPGSPINAAVLSRLVPLNILRADQQAALLRSAKILARARGEILPVSRTQALFLLSGAVTLLDAGHRILESLRTDDLQATTRRLATRWPQAQALRVTEEARFLAVDADLLDVLLSCETTDALIVAEPGEIEDAGDDWMLRLLQLPFVQRIAPAQLQLLFQRLQRIEAAPGETLIREGDAGEHFFILLSGSCRVSRAQSVLAELHPGSCFGEEALLGDGVRNASVTMARPGVLLRLARSDFHTLLNAPLARRIDLASARARVTAGQARWLDVRLPSESADDGVDCGFADARQLPLHLLRLQLASLDIRTTWIACCDTGRRSAVAAFVLMQRGYDAYVLGGGVPRGPRKS